MIELYIPPERPKRNPTNGRFLKGIPPHNKGKKMSDYMDDSKIAEVKRIGMKNLRPNYKLAGSNAKPVVAIKDGNLLGVFKSSNDASRKTGICGRNIRHCCLGKRKNAGGIQWFYENGDWTNIIK